MKNIAPEIIRQRLLIEALFSIEVDESVIKDYFDQLTKELNLRVYGEPIIHSPSGEGKEDNQGYDAFIPLIDSGIVLYIWTNKHFLSCVIYTCKKFSNEKAVQFTQSYFKTTEIEFKEF